MNNEIAEHSLLKSATLHLLPGLLGGICYFALVPLVISNGFPTVMALILAGVIVLIPFELGFLIFQKRATGKKLFGGIIRYIKKNPIWQYFVLIPAVFILTGTSIQSLWFHFRIFKNIF